MGNRTITPSGWSSSAIGSVCTFIRGVSWKKSQERRSPTAGAVPVLRIPNVQETLELTELLYINGLTKAQQAKARVKRGWILLVGSNGNPKRVGNCVYVAEPRDFLFASFLIGATPTDSRRVNSEFLYRLLSSSPVQHDIWQSVQGSTGLSNIDLNSLKSLHVQIPPFPEQRKIAAILSSVDDAIDKTRAVIDQVQVVKRGLMQELLTVGIHGRHTRLKKTEIGEIPADWAVTRIGDLGQRGRPAVKAGPFGSSLKKSFYVLEGYRVYGQEQVLAGDLSIGNYYINEERFRLLKSCEVKAGDILVSLVGTFGEAIVVPPDAEPGIINPRLLRLSLDPQLLLPEFFCFWLRSSRTRKLLADAAQGGTMGVLNAGIVKKLALGIPSLPEQSAIVAALTAFDRRLDSESALKDALVSLKASLMSILLAGDLRVLPPTEAA